MVQQSSPPWSESQNTITFQQTSTLYKYHTRDHIDYYREHFFLFSFSIPMELTVTLVCSK